METLCVDSLWNTNLTWETIPGPRPHFTQCFQDTVFTWVICGIIWILAVPIEIARLCRRPVINLPLLSQWTPLGLIKITLSFGLIIICAVSWIYDLKQKYGVETYLMDLSATPAAILANAIKMFTYMVVLWIQCVHHMRGVHTSGVMFLFWLGMSILSIVNYWTIFSPPIEGLQRSSYTHYILIAIHCPMVFLQFIVSWFSDWPVAMPIDKRMFPVEYASFPSQVSFWWFNSLVWNGYKKPLTVKDVWSLPRDLTTEAANRQFGPHMYKGGSKNQGATNYHDNLAYAGDSKDIPLPALDDKRQASKTVSLPGRIREPVKANFLTACCKALYWEYLICCSFKFVGCWMAFVSPQMLNLLLDYLRDPIAPVWHGYLFACLMFFGSMFESVLNSQHEYRLAMLMTKVKAGMITTIYRKSLKLSGSGRKDFTTGEIVNLMSVDVQRVCDVLQFISCLWYGPMQVVVAMWLLWNQLGVASLAGLGVMIAMIPISSYMSAKMRSEQIYLMKAKDLRTKLMNEVLNGIKILKLYAWELCFTGRLSDYRKDEIKSLVRQALYQSGVIMVFLTVPFLVAVVSFICYVYDDPTHILDANKAFVSLSLFNILRIPLGMMPLAVSYLMTTLVAIRRINKYLSGHELDPNVVEREMDKVNAVTIDNCDFSWAIGEKATLKNIDIKVPHGQLVAIVGQVGSGKTSLLSALLGDMEKLGGRVNLSGQIAYVPQQAWILNATVRDNITFMKPYDPIRYAKVVKACALETDFAIMSAGDLTEIGERGINLSGGQKQRISIARAVYSDADIYLLDDPLSAVDAHVGRHIFEQVIGSKGLLRGKTRILVTHKMTLIPEVDMVYVMMDGAISESGSYRQLLDRKGAFAELLKHYVEDQGAEATEETIEEALEEVPDAISVHMDMELERQYSMRGANLSQSGSIRYKAVKRKSSVSSVSSTATRSTTKRIDSKPAAAGGQEGDKGKLINEEFAEEGNVKLAVYLDYLRSLGILGVLCVIAIYCIGSAFTISQSLWLSAWSDDSMYPERTNDTALRDKRLGVYAGLGLGESTFNFLGTIGAYWLCLKSSRVMHERMLRRIMHSPMSFFDTTPLGRILNRFSKDIDTADVLMRFNIRMCLEQFFKSVITFILLAIQSLYFLIALVPISILYYLIQKLYIASSRQLNRIESTSRSPIYNHFSETVAGASSIRAYGASQRFIVESDRRTDVNNSCYYPSLVAARWLSVRLELIGYSCVFLAGIFAVVSKGSSSAGLAGLAVSYAMTLTNTLSTLVRFVTEVEKNIVSIERCLEYTRAPIEAAYFNDATKPEKNWPIEGRIELKDYSTRYRDGLDLVVKQVNLTIQPGEKVGIVGRTGAGKSSLTLALFRIIEPAEGHIIIDGKDISVMGLFDLRSRLTIIPQDPVLFTGSLRLNLDPFERYSDAEIWQALEHAHLKSYVKSLEAGLDHMISEGGENLSIGQKQLICLARALLRKTKVLVLDEATAAIDMETDDLIQSTIRTQFSNCTIVTIAHRLNTIIDYDRILVMDKGRVAEFDAPQNLLGDKNTIFYSMARDANLV